MIINTLAEEVGKDIPFEQKQYYVNHMVDAAIRKEEKDSEHRSTVISVLKYGGMAIVAGLFFVGGLFVGNSCVKTPSKFM